MELKDSDREKILAALESCQASVNELKLMMNQTWDIGRAIRTGGALKPKRVLVGNKG